MRDIYIYALLNPDTGIVRYVGQTATPNLRLKNHIRDKTNAAKHEWIQSLLNEGKSPLMTILEVTTQEMCGEREFYWIDRLRNEGNDLLNSPNAKQVNPQRRWGHENAITSMRLSEDLYELLKATAAAESITMLELIKRFLKLGFLLLEVEKSGGKFIIRDENGNDKQIVLL